MKTSSSLLVLLTALACSLPFSIANGAVTLLGTQYQPDPYFPAFDCYWNAGNYPNGCRTPTLGATVHVYLKNTGASSVTGEPVDGGPAMSSGTTS